MSGRAKKPYSIWRKMEDKRVTFEQLSDIFAIRVVVGSMDDCYRALGILHRSWRHVPGRFKDYISIPKSNNYRSLHTEIIGPENHRIELQIRSSEMHEIAERGIAAHWSYKDKVNGGRPLANIDAYEFAALADRVAEGRRYAGGISRAHAARAVSGSGLLLHAEGAVDLAAARGDADRFCLFRSHRSRRHLRGRAGQRAARAAGDEVEERRHGRDHPLAQAGAVGHLGSDGGDRQGAGSSIKRYLRNAEKVEHQRMGRAILEKAFRDAGEEFSEKALGSVLEEIEAGQDRGRLCRRSAKAW